MRPADTVSTSKTRFEPLRGLVLTALLALLPLAAYGQAPAEPPADRPVEREDRNSAIAHRELVEKARTGRIDLYFLGDSIVRRWGALDYPELLANWRRNFHGWNAANFGWGADRVENVLWRIENGELEGVDPRVVVLLAGTNNVGGTGRTPEAREALTSNVTRGIRALVERVRALAPGATVILMGLFPRNDNVAVMPTIDAINRGLALLADGSSVRYLNINDRLADQDGRLFEGISDDGLHPSVRGYQVWADALEPMLRELLGPRGDEDQAPGPTGNPAARLD